MKLNYSFLIGSSVGVSLLLTSCGDDGDFLTKEAQARLSYKNVPAAKASEVTEKTETPKSNDAKVKTSSDDDATTKATTPVKPVVKIDPAVLKKAMRSGKTKYAISCQSCHQANGEGLPKIYPPLAKSDWVNELDNEQLIRIMLRGLSGSIKVNGKPYNSMMTTQTLFLKTDKEFADVLTYVLNTWGNRGGLVTAEEVKKVRATEKNNIMKILTVKDIKGAEKFAP